MTDNKPVFHEPQHPLPAEIQKMKKDETVCKYCGVSYLIHREIKVLQDELKAVKKELEHYKGLEIREKELQNELDLKNQRITQVEDLVKQRDAMVSELQVQTQDLVNSLSIEAKARKELENKLAEGAMNLKETKLKHQSLLGKLPAIKKSLFTQRDNINAIKTEIKNNQSALQTFCTTKLTEVAGVIQQIGDEKHTTNLKISRLNLEIDSYRKTESDLQTKLTLMQKEVEGLKTAESHVMSQLRTEVEEARKKKLNLQAELSQVTSKVHDSQSRVKDLEKMISNEQNKNKGLSFELEQFKTKLSQKGQELDSLTSQLRNKDILHEQSIKKLENVIAQRENSLQEKTKAWDELRKKLHEQERQEKLALQQASASSVQANDMKSELERVRKDCEALKAEREMMIIAHQNQIQDLRTSFRNKMEEMEGWPDKLDKALRQERDKHKRELDMVETKFKENFSLELDIEKQKFETMYKKNLSELRDSESKLRAEISAVQARHRAEVSDLHKQTADAKSRSRESENALREEVAGLKRIIADLEGRLGRLDSGDSTLAISLKGKIKELERTIEEQKISCEKLRQQCDSSKEQIIFLEETVRKECEERFELTEALSAAREELLMLKRPSGGYTSMNRSASSTPTRRNSEALDPLKEKPAEEISFQKSTLKSLNVGGPYPPSKPKEGATETIIASNDLRMDFEGDPVKTPSSGIKGNFSSRRR